MTEDLVSLLTRIQKEWGLSDEQMAALSHVDVSTYARWVVSPPSSEASIPPGMDNAVPLASIYRALCRRFPDKAEEQVSWLFKGHADFGGNKPIDIAASSVENLYWLSYYLESSRT